MANQIAVKTHENFTPPPDPRNPVEVLNECLEACLNGRWVRAALVRDFLNEDHKPRACAVGLLNIYGGNMTEDELHPGRYDVTYPHIGWTDSSIKAARCLYAATKVEPDWGMIQDMRHNQIGEGIVDYNDSVMTKDTVNHWFKKAIQIAKLHYG